MKTLLQKAFVYILSLVINTKDNFSQSYCTSILIIAPHPDDEIIGLGGFILKQIQKNSQLHLVYLTDGEGSGATDDLEAIKSHRIAMTNTIHQQLGLAASQVSYLHIADGGIPHRGENGFDSTTNLIADLIDRIQPDMVFATSRADYWPYDHVACSELATAAVKQSAIKPELWFYWVWAWYNLRPLSLFKLNYKNLFKIDIAEQLAAKKELMDIYLKPLSPEGKPWSGVLPKAMLYPFSKPVEIVEKYKDLTQRR